MASLGKCTDLSRKNFTSDEVMAFFNGEIDLSDSDVDVSQESGHEDDISANTELVINDDEREAVETIGTALFRSLYT